MARRQPSEMSRQFMAAIRAAHPPFVAAVRADLRINLGLRGEATEMTTRREEVREAARLALVSDAFLGQVLYRAKAATQARGWPVVPALLHRLAMVVAQVAIGDPVVVAPGIYIAHGQVVIDGITEVGPGCVFFPWVTLGLKAGNPNGPHLGRNVHVGTGAKIVGPVRVGDGARIGANAVVLEDVPAGATVAGVPARVVRAPVTPPPSA